MSWQILLSISVIAMSVSVLLRRVLLKNLDADAMAYAIIFQGMVGIVTGVYAVAKGFSVPNLGQYGLTMIAVFLLFALGNILSAEVFKLVDASLFSMYFATGAVWVMLSNRLVFHDPLSVKQLLGVLLIFVSIVILVYQKGLLKIDRGTKLGLLMGAVYGVAGSGWVYVGRHADVPTWNALSFIIPSLLILVLRPKSIYKMKPMLSGKVLGRMVLLGLVFGLSALTSLFAYSRGNVNLVATLQQTSIILTTVMAAFFLKETDRMWRKTAAALVCTIAVIMIV